MVNVWWIGKLTWGFVGDGALFCTKRSNDARLYFGETNGRIYPSTLS